MAREDYRLRRMARLVRGRDRILDLGCSGKPNPFLEGGEVVGLDRSPVAGTDTAPPGAYRRILEGDVMDLPDPFGPGSFDAVVAGELLEHLERPLDFLRACRETLSPGGLLVLSTPNPNSPIERLLTLSLSRRFFCTGDHVTLYPQRWLIRMLHLAGFREVRLASGGFPVPGIGLLPFPRPWCYQTIAAARRPAEASGNP